MKAARKFAEAERSVIEKILRELVNNRSKSNCFDKNHAVKLNFFFTSASWLFKFQSLLS